MNEAPRYKCDFEIIHHTTKKSIFESMEGQYLDFMKTEIYKKHDRRFNTIKMEIERIR